MTHDDYSTIGGINWSALKHLQDSPLHYRHHLDTPREDTDAFRLGRATHTAILEPDRFAAEYAVWDGERRAGNAWKEFQANHADVTILTADQRDRALAIAKAVRANREAMVYLRDGEAERAVTWTDAATGLRCKARLDWLSRSQAAVVDVKTTPSIERRRFRNTIVKYGYHNQLAHYRNGSIAAGLFVDPRAVIIAAETSPPFDVGVFVLDSAALEAGESEVARLLDLLKTCLDRDEWPGRYDAEQVLDLPDWVNGEPEIAFIEE